MIGPIDAHDPAPASAKLREAAQSFEAIFTQMLLQSMRSTVKKTDLFHGGRGEEMFGGLMDQAIAQKAALRGRGFGIAEMILQQVARSTYSG